MNDAIVESINSKVGEDDILIHIGDWAFGGWENIWKLRKLIKCKNIINVNGNHDDQIKKNKFFPFLEKNDAGEIIEIENCENYRIHLDKSDKNPKDVFAKDFFITTNELLKIKVNGQEMTICHFPWEEWENMDRGSWMIHGHNHHQIDDNVINVKYKRIDVGWPTILSFDELKDIMDKRGIKAHHS